LREQVASQFTQQRLIARLTSFFGILSLILASVGLYGVTAYNAGRRVGEIGVRMTLGADRGNVILLVLRGTLPLILFGLAIGVPLTFVAGRLLGKQLYGLNSYDPWVTASAVASLTLCAVVAAFIPAIRASMISPVEALRAH
jgi:ABC-type antimicrobial peptide transport system permease subunit